MTDEKRLFDNFIKQSSPKMALQQFNGTGYLRCQHGTTHNCTFSIIRLLNGRLQVSVIPDRKYSSSDKWEAWLSHCEPFEIEGEDGQGTQISATNIHFTRTNFNGRKTLIGYAQSATRHLQETPNFSVAYRGYAFLIAQHKYRVDGQWLGSQFNEPIFTSRGWLQALIPTDSLANFLATAYPIFTAQDQSLELGNMIDHYLQALTLHSAWPLSVGIFTAMETLKAAFLRQPENSEFEYWVVPPEEFENNHEMFNEIIDILCKHFPRFCNLDKNERQSLTAQLQGGLKRRSYRTQLKRMFNQFGVAYNSNELQSFIEIRNRIIHEGTPAESNLSSDDYTDQTSKAWKQIEAATSLFERTLLAVLGYTGSSALFETSEHARANE
jgi:hypothetical protein